MAAPNLVNVSTITAKSVQAALTTTLTTEVLANAASSNKVFKVNNIIIANIDGSSSVDDGNTNNLSLYPNPANSIFNLTYEATIGTAKITIINAAGQQVFTTNENTNQGFNTFNYNVENLSNGTYFIKVQNGSNVSVTPLVVIH